VTLWFRAIILRWECGKGRAERVRAVGCVAPVCSSVVLPFRT